MKMCSKIHFILTHIKATTFKIKNLFADINEQSSSGINIKYKYYKLNLYIISNPTNKKVIYGYVI